MVDLMEFLLTGLLVIIAVAAVGVAILLSKPYDD
jgi:hypothetical protein